MGDVRHMILEKLIQKGESNFWKAKSQVIDSNKFLYQSYLMRMNLRKVYLGIFMVENIKIKSTLGFLNKIFAKYSRNISKNL